MSGKSVHHAVQHAPNVCNGISALDFDTKMLSHENTSPFSAEEIFCSAATSGVAIEIPQVNRNWIEGVSAVILKLGDGPRPVHDITVLGQIFNEYSLNPAMM